MANSYESRLLAAHELLQSGQSDLARHRLEALVAENPERLPALQLLGNLWYQLGEPTKACGFFRRVLQIDDAQPDAWCNLAIAEFQVTHFSEGFAAIDRALALAPGYASAYATRGAAYARQKRDVEALNDFSQALRLNPQDSLSAVHYWACACRLCWWEVSERLLPTIQKLVDDGSPLVPPFSLLSVLDSPQTHRRSAVNRAKKFRAVGGVMPNVVPTVEARYKIAYISADFQEHATTYLMAGVFEHHDKALVETFAVSIGPGHHDAMRTRLQKAFDHFVDAQSWTDGAVAQWLIDQGVHILVDLKGHTDFARPGIVALKPAPVVVSYLGYPGTSGMAAIDYIIGDAVVTPFEQQAAYTEAIVQMPHSYQCNDRSRTLPVPLASRHVEGLPTDALVFAAFNQAYKIRPPVFDAWCRILRRVPGSVLWLLCDQPHTRQLLQQRASEMGVSADRVVFARRVGYEEHLGRHHLADLFLDTWPYSAHTTASDALWMALPVLTIQGESFASRVASSLLVTVGLSELVVQNLTAYENKAVDLGQNRELLLTMKARLNGGRHTTPLFDTAGFTKHLEVAYGHMISRWKSGAAPVPFAVRGDGSVVCPSEVLF